MVNLNLSIIEQAIKDLIKAQNWDYVREIKTYGGDFDDDINAVIRRFPAIWITFQGSKSPEKISHNKTRIPVTFVVLVGSYSVRNEETQRQGDAVSIGTYQMLSDIQNLLTENDLSSQSIKGLEPLELGRIKTIFNTKTKDDSISVLSQEFHTSYVLTASDRDREEAATEAEIHRINVDYHFIPDDGVKDESDLIELKES
ncbi:phage protein Gp37 [Acinetobacter junii]|uniref:phage protein Gp37 n=1 Tax=Acinetobacter junii TaxID=40215 RepID=UPI0005B356B9|nr:phage protein Gp37 [Acinetobacter junii]MDU2409600.1 phage protein Gp37 [Acinetobacter junii]